MVHWCPLVSVTVAASEVAMASLLACHCVLERARIPLLKGYGQALEQKCHFPGFLIDDSDASADLLSQLDIHGPSRSCHLCSKGLRVYAG